VVSERLHVSTTYRQPWWVAVVAAVIGLPLVVVAPVVTVVLLITVSLGAAVMPAWNLRTANVLTSASVGLLIPVGLYLGLVILR
jgi:hypothetical protein